MTFTNGTYEITQAQGDLLLYTTVEGPAASMGHDLILRPTQWRGTVIVGDSVPECQVKIVVDMNTLVVCGSKGGIKRVGEGDLKIINANIRKVLAVETHPTLTFESTEIIGDWEKATLAGQLTLCGRSETQSFEITANPDETISLDGAITQTRYGIKPFSTMIGAMRIGDDVTVKVAISLS
ncbi:MAG: YceI family protein [Propionibacteriaceae bacterium]